MVEKYLIPKFDSLEREVHIILPNHNYYDVVAWLTFTVYIFLHFVDQRSSIPPSVVLSVARPSLSVGGDTPLSSIELHTHARHFPAQGYVV